MVGLCAATVPVYTYACKNTGSLISSKLLLSMNAPSPIAPELISVIIPCYNHGAYLAEVINSVLAQTYTNIEIIVVDDGSTDNTKQVACGFEKVHYIHQHNQGLSAARNTGIKNSKGSY